MEYQVSSVFEGIKQASHSGHLPDPDGDYRRYYSNTHDQFAVALSAHRVGVVGHEPRKFSHKVRHELFPSWRDA